MTHRWEFLNDVANRIGAVSYLEIGCAANQTFDQIRVPHKVGVDAFGGGTLRLSSDVFFAANQERFDLIFIDGLHIAEQAVHDIDNALGCLSDYGLVAVHDALPDEFANATEQMTYTWNGTVYRALLMYRSDPDVMLATWPHDQGVTLLKPGKNPDPTDIGDHTWDEWLEHRNEWLNVSEDPLDALVEAASS